MKQSEVEALRIDVKRTMRPLRRCPVCASDAGWNRGAVVDIVNCYECGALFVIGLPARDPVAMYTYDALGAVV